MIETEIPAEKPKLTKMGIAHGAVRFAASTSVKMIVGTAIAQVVPTETKAQKAKLVVGTFVISGIVSDAAKTYASKELNEAVELFTELKQKVQSEKTATENDNPTE